MEEKKTNQTQQTQTITVRDAILMSRNMLDGISIPMSVMFSLSPEALGQMKRQIAEPIEVVKANLLECAKILPDGHPAPESEASEEPEIKFEGMEVVDELPEGAEVIELHPEQVNYDGSSELEPGHETEESKEEPDSETENG